MLLANRTEEPAQRLAQEFGGEAVALNNSPIIWRKLTSLSVRPRPTTLSLKRWSARLWQRRRNRPAFFIDISVPRNIDPAVGKIPNVFVFDIDDLESVISSNIREREREAERAELIVESEIMQFQQSLRALDIGPTIGALRQKLQEIARRN